MQKTSWHDIYTQRVLWAKDAYTDFIEQFDADRLINLNASDKNEISIIVHGSTQVGKTTFILTLLGIDEAKISQVDKVLRAGQTLGNSATSRSSRYRRSEDEYWHFSHRNKSKERFSDSEALSLLERLRNNVEDGHTKDLSTIDIFIPSIYFSVNMNTKVDLLIHDLPGINARNENENRYVKELVEKYIITADVIFLVGKIDSLGFLKNEELNNNSLLTWYFNSNTYKVILTHSFSNATIQRKIIDGNINSLESFNNYLFEQINTMELSLPPTIKDQVYPIECGLSWNNITKDDNDRFKRRSIQLRETIFNKLYQDIENSMHPLSRLKMGFMLPEYLKQQKKKESEEYSVKIKYLETKIECLQNLLKIEKKSIIRNRNKINKIEGEIRKNDDFLEENQRKTLESSEENDLLKPINFKITQSFDNKKSVQYLKDFLFSEIYAIESSWQDWCSINYKLTNNDLQHELNNVLNDCGYEEIKKRLDDYWLDGYFSDSNYCIDVKSILSFVSCLKGLLFKKTQCYVEDFLKKTKKTLNANHLKLQQKIVDSENFIAERERGWLDARRELCLLEDNCKLRMLELDDKIDKSALFHNHIYDAYKKREHALNMLFEKNNENKEKQLCYLFLMNLLRKDFLYINNLQPLMK